jgi:hypothetical protein
MPGAAACRALFRNPVADGIVPGFDGFAGIRRIA